MTPTSASRGFTLIELLIVIVIVAILAGIALPSYQNYIKRGHANTAAADLTALASSVENHFQRTLSYPASQGSTADIKSVIKTWSPASKTGVFGFAYAKDASADAYTLTATGAGTMSGCTLTLTHQNDRTGGGSNCGGFSW